ncbi:endo-1,4-beta-xylanase 5-like [Salvia miltiorrhiza]|uniref:endo-1,4-beta-xylanase 5-like n=1 Tax=Salvia miltiorrhiza TaxID=226208 RepID=UPI0025ABBF22|nr:endo-1,4-beta-xylanase 5-like [Salvia miltiorrhiza]
MAFLTVFTLLSLFFGFEVHAVPYDYSYTLGCVAKPKPPQYYGGIAVNSEFDDGLTGWAAVGNAAIATAKSPCGNSYAVVSGIRTPRSDGISQAFNVDRDILYTVSAWFQVSVGEAAVQVKIVTSAGNRTANWITAKAGCWTMLKGGFHVKVTEAAELHFETNSTGFDMWVDSISVQPFMQEEWTRHQALSLEKVRKGKVRFEVVDSLENPVADAAVLIKQHEPHFPFGCNMNRLILDSQAYQRWFLEKRFKYSVFENELKWLYTEKTQGVVNYTVPDAMLAFAKKHRIALRGHTILWEARKFQPEWQKKLSPDELREAVLKRVKSVATKYKGQFIDWDVINENMHYALYSNVTNNGIDVFRLLRQLDPRPIPFLNEFNVIEDCSIQSKANTWQYLQKIDQLRKGGYGGPLGIGLQGHFQLEPNFPFIRASIDMLHATGSPIWITEFDVNIQSMPWMVRYVEPLLHELHSHPYVNGIIIWGAVWPNMSCFRMCLTDDDYNNLPAGDAVDKFMSEFIRVPDTNMKTDRNGAFEASLFHGEYEASITLPDGAQPPTPHSFNLKPHGDVPVIKFKTRGGKTSLFNRL